MTARRQERKGLGLRFACLAVLAIAALAWSCPQARAASTERIVVNRHSGLAIDGFDPVAYFTDSEAAKGAPDIEAAQGGAIWRFRSEANRAAFMAHPEVYGPQFGGYDPIDVARGRAVAGRPQLWLIAGERLYLFSREESLRAFAADPAAILRPARDRWPALAATLSDY
jgi:YHS domain-containing protein